MKSYSEELEILASRILVLMNREGLLFETAFSIKVLNSQLNGYSRQVVKSGVSKLLKKWRQESKSRQQVIQLVGARAAERQANRHLAEID